MFLLPSEFSQRDDDEEADVLNVMLFLERERIWKEL